MQSQPQQWGGRVAPPPMRDTMHHDRRGGGVMRATLPCAPNDDTWAVLRSCPTCHRIRRTVIDTARESLVFHFFSSSFASTHAELDYFSLLDLCLPHIALSDSCLKPHHVYCLTDSLVPLLSSSPSPLMSS